MGFVANLNAQTYVTSFFNRGETVFGIPGIFTNNGHTHMVKATVVDNQITNCTFYDNDFTTDFLNYDCDFDINDILLQFWDVTNLTTNMMGNSGSFLFVFTQNLFNSDNHYEYIEAFETGWNIKSTNGSIVQTINAEEGFVGDHEGGIMKVDDIFYLILGEKSTDYTEAKTLVYRIDQPQGLTKIDMQLPISVFPTMPTREQQITVELGEDTNVNEITVVNSLGQVVKHLPLEEGQRTVTIPANELGSGLNVVNARNGQGQGSCKIIVR